MVPASFVILNELPLLSNGKIDLRALPSPEAVRPDLAEAFVAPRTPVEKLLAGAWADLLGLPHVGIRLELLGKGLITVAVYLGMVVMMMLVEGRLLTGERVARALERLILGRHH